MTDLMWVFTLSMHNNLPEEEASWGVNSITAKPLLSHPMETKLAMNPQIPTACLHTETLEEVLFRSFAQGSLRSAPSSGDY